MGCFISWGEVLLRLSASATERLANARNLDVIYGGSEANVACALAQWSIPSRHVTVLPDHAIGTAALQSLQRFGVQTDFIQRQAGRMGIYFLEHGVSLRSPQVIYDRFHSAFAEMSQPFEWEKILADASWLHWSGITPAVSQAAADATRTALHAARKLNITISADINYRRVLWQYGKKPTDIMPELISLSDYLVGGVDDFNNCLGIALPNSFEEVCPTVTQTYPNVKGIGNTIRQTHSASHQELQGLWWDSRSVTTSRNYSIDPIVDRIGSGDAFMAGLVYGLWHQHTPAQIIEFATAAAALKHTHHGDALHATVAEVAGLATNLNTGKLLR
jgi:2-dehydro-3-deoxygluconokinase